MYPQTALVRENFGQTNHLFHTQVPEQLRKSFYNFTDALILRDQIVYQFHDELPKYKDSHILILGGGPSTETIDWENTDCDFAWSMNHCFFNEKIFNTPIDLLTIGCAVDLQNEKLLEFLAKYNSLAAFELHVKYYLASANAEKNNEEANEAFYNNDRKICYQTKWYSQLGTGARQMIFASYLRPRKISFVGFDGPQAIYDKQHAFIGDDQSWDSQHMIPGSIRHLSKDQVIQRFVYEYRQFWFYMIRMFPDVEYYSLDRQNQYHAVIL